MKIFRWNFAKYHFRRPLLLEANTSASSLVFFSTCVFGFILSKAKLQFTPCGRLCDAKIIVIIISRSSALQLRQLPGIFGLPHKYSSLSHSLALGNKKLAAR